MALTAAPADPVERETAHLPPKTYAEAVEDALMRDEPPPDESLIKESPPRPAHIRNTSEPRPLGEVIDDIQRTPSPGSPMLRHPRGRLEKTGSRESYAHVVKEFPSPLNGNSLSRGLGFSVTDPKPVNGHALSQDAHDGANEDESPQTPVREHRDLDAPSPDTNGVSEFDQQAATATLEPSPVIWEHYSSNKSGENLTSVRTSRDFGLTERQTKTPTARYPHEAPEKRTTELVSGRQAGAGWSQSAIHWAPLNVPLQRRLQTLMVLCHTLSIVGLLAFFFVFCAIPLLWPLIVPYLLLVIFSRASVDGNLSYRSEWWRSSKVWSLFASYFPARLHRSEPLEPTRKYIFGYHPHGIISHGALAAFGTEALGFSQLFPGITNTLLTLDANFTVPLYREYVLRLGLASVSRESCENLLSKGGANGEGMGRAITIVIGGARESLEAVPHTLRLVLKRRKGFIKLAIRMGADLVPVLAFGENDIYDQLDGNAHPFVHKAQLLVKKFMGFTVPLFHARGVFNYDVGIMPYRRPINIVVGHPIHIMQSKTPDPKYVDEIHALYVKELLRIWDEWKDTFAPNRIGELEIFE